MAAALMMLCSGLMHAFVNALVKSGQDKMASRALLDGFSAVLVLPAAFFVPLPQAAWGFLAASALAHFLYLLCVIRAFQVADFSVAYPIMRGAAPALSAFVAVVFLKQPITLVEGIAIALVCVGVAVLGMHKTTQRETIPWAIAAGVTIAAYTVIDAQGVRAAPSAWSYIIWVFLVLGFIVAPAFALWARKSFVLAVSSQWKIGLLAGACSIASYSLALWALRLGEIPRLAALRETSVLFGLVLAAFVLKEKLTRSRLIAACGIAIGAICLVAQT